MPFMTKLSAAATEFIEQMGLMAEEDGYPRIACRMLALLTILQRPVPFDEIAETLQISRASVSTNTRLLETQGFLARECRIGERKDSFSLIPDLAIKFLEQTLVHHRRVHQLATETARKLPRHEAAAKPALQEMADFKALVIKSTEKTLEEWNALKARRARPLRAAK